MLNQFVFYIILLISKLPMKVLYVVSDIIFYTNEYIIGYRKKVVKENIRNSFPDKSAEEIDSISTQFFRNFCDYLVEMIKSFTITSDELHIRVQHINQDIFKEVKEEGKNVILLAGHVFNWEWMNAFSMKIPQKKAHPVYRIMQNQFWEKKIKLIRNKYGNESLEAKQVIRHILKNQNNGDACYMFVADQTPNVVEYGINFLHQRTPVFIGYDKLATKLDLGFIYCDIKKVKRGYYQVNYYRIYPENEKFEEFEIVKKFHQSLEKTLAKNPANYLWSHRKWKYQDLIKKMITS
ncbi:MAG: lipid A biosynthesis acyltransferase [Flavobacteriales bacterium]|nr:MAG: lipid A biosynthesis acyltransferase [Flavobacteriales bacterium]